MSSNSSLELDEGAADEASPTDGEAPDVAEVEPEEPGGVDLTPDMIFEVLKNERRRRVLRYLDGKEEPMKLGALAEEIAARENDKTVDALSSRERKRVYVGLYQCHLPKMDDMEIVAFNRNRGLVELDENATYLEPYLDTGSEEQPPWHLYYGSIAAVGAVLYGISLSGIVPYGPAVSVTLGIVIAALAGCSLAHVLAATDGDD